MLEPMITVPGNVAAVPTLREVGTGARVSGFRLANTPRRQDRTTGEWSDGPTTWFGVTAWRALAENCAASLKPGDRVVVTGRLRTRTWTTPEGDERSGLEIDATSVGYDLGRTSAQSVKAPPLLLTSDPGEQVSGLPLQDEPDEPDDALVPELVG